MKIVIDDYDRDQVPETPWTANAYGVEGSEEYAPGFGASPALALADLLSQMELS